MNTCPFKKGDYSAEEKIWRPVFEHGHQGKEVKRLASETMQAITKGPMGISRSDVVLLRDNYGLSTWLLLGACLQGLVAIISPSLLYALLPACLVLGSRIINVFLQCIGLRRNLNMDQVIKGKFSIHHPDVEGRLVGEPAQQGPLIVYFLSAQCNHPLGMFAPGFKEIADQFEDMIKALEKEPKKYAYRTSTAWIGRGNDRTSAQDIMHVFYFDNLDGLHRFAHAPSHRVGWDYWNKNYAKFDHIAISHEIYVTKDSEAVEGIFVNYRRAGFSGQNVKLANGSYVAPLVDASEGQYRTSKGRLNKVDHGKSNDRYNEPEYEKAHALFPEMHQ